MYKYKRLYFSTVIQVCITGYCLLQMHQVYVDNTDVEQECDGELNNDYLGPIAILPVHDVTLAIL